MRIIGMNEMIMIAGDLRPMPATATIESERRPRELYAGAVEATPMTMLEMQAEGVTLEALVALDLCHGVRA